MCGIVGAVSNRNIVPILVQGLARLEYRGYDSCGVAVYANGLQRARSTARVAELAEQVSASHLEGSTGIAHTRWATHGAPLVHNAHPHFSHGPGADALSRPGRIALVHNGIIENHDQLRSMLQAKGYVFQSQTDTEVIAHLIDSRYDGDLFEAVKATLEHLHGAYAIAVFCKDEPHRLIGARAGSPLILGVGQDGQEHFLASDAMALAGVTDQIVYLNEGDIVDIQLGKYWLFDQQGKPVAAAQRPVRTVHAHSGAAELGPYRHFMQKEIFEQPRAIADTLQGVDRIMPELFDQQMNHAPGSNAARVFREIDSVLILACGTSYYSGCTAKYWLESIAKIPTQVEVASEYRYRESVPNPRTLVVTITQSGETADTLAALRHAQSLGMTHTLTICNVAADVARPLTAMRHLPAALQAVLALEPQVIAWAEDFAKKENALFLGRGLHYPIALEGALKLKEISYIHAEAYPAGELKHGPLALVTSAMPVVTVAPNDALLEKLKSNMHEVRARGGVLYVLADADSHIESGEGIHVIRMPEHYGELSPLLHVVPLQLLAYHTACARGTDVDKPRNLAKSVTVE
jgi:glucosamine--fructose-6-phosphate aminotransferase (isomerizing)